MVSRIGRNVAVYGDCGGWERVACGEEQRGEGGSDVAWVESRRAVLDRRDGGEKRERRGFSSFFLFSGMVGCGSDGMMIFR